MQVFVVAEKETGKAEGIFILKPTAIDWMDTKGYSWPEYTIQTWTLDKPDEGYEEWI